MRINFVSTESRDNYSGGWSGNSYNVFMHLNKKEGVELEYIGPIKPQASQVDKYLSKIKRVAGFKSKFYYFSNRRLARVKSEIEQKLTPGFANYTFFMGSTHWLDYHPSTPYGAFLDASFRTYFDNNIKTEDFSSKDIARIELKEKRWLENATHVFWASEWAKEEAIKQYQLSGENHFVVGIGGNLAVPAKIDYKGEINFLLIAQDFMLKGGDMAFAAFKEVHVRYSEAKFYILGQEPPSYVLNHPGVIYPGYLHKDIPEENVRFLKILSESFCLIHATKSDAIPQVIIECGYFGCPTIAPARFAIPELIQSGVTGVLLHEEFTVKDIVKEMIVCIEDKGKYEQMRKNVRDFYLRKFTYDSVSEMIMKEIGAS